MRSIIDITWFKFNKLTVTSYSGKDNSGGHLWECECDCGNNTKVKSGNLKSGQVKSCGCLLKNKSKETTDNRLKKNNLLGKNFGELVVIEFVSESKSGNIWLCKCSCGLTYKVRATRLVNNLCK